MGLGAYRATELCACDFLFPPVSYKNKARHIHVQQASLFELETTYLDTGFQNTLS